ncbi:hypothetical protein T10_8249 [Trichinella papuae]|uniref:Uncharacterized protein n=1 Tax=Trichinella papuae TaxID=268474 RepID=A0A0V1N6Y5_9BILA|nr:hypothetical protein T10_8249 [Trichinella papuae]
MNKLSILLKQINICLKLLMQFYINESFISSSFRGAKLLINVYSSSNEVFVITKISVFIFEKEIVLAKILTFIENVHTQPKADLTDKVK